MSLLMSAMISVLEVYLSFQNYVIQCAVLFTILYVRDVWLGSSATFARTLYACEIFRVLFFVLSCIIQK